MRGFDDAEKKLRPGEVAAKPMRSIETTEHGVRKTECV